MRDYSTNCQNSVATPKQLCLDLRFSALADATQYLNPQGYGFFSILKRNNSGRFSQRSYTMNKMHSVLGDGSDIFQQKDSDFYISQATFCSADRKLMNLKSIQLMYMDIDTYRIELYRGMTPQVMAERFCILCDMEGIPRPSFIVFSGRGLQAKWIFEVPIPRAAHVRWRATTSYFNSMMQQYGADPGARDASRVLRVVGSVNTKSGEICRIVYDNREESGELVRYDFDYLADWLPLTRPYKGNKSSEEKGKGGQFCPEEYGLQTLHWAFLEDMRSILAMRGSIHEGLRQRFLMTMMCDLALSGQVTPGRFYTEAQFLASQIDSSWTYHSQDFGTVYQKFKDHMDGKRVKWNGREVTPLYTPSAETRIKWFEVTEEEQRLLTVIHSKEIRREFNTEKKRKWRKAQGMQTSAEYNAKRAEKKEFNTQNVQSLKKQGYSQRKIAEMLGISRALVQKYFAP